MMSQEERETLNSIAKIVKSAKLWIPIIVFLCTGFWFALKLGLSAQSTYDNEIAKKIDLQPISAQQETILSQQRQILSDIKEIKANYALAKEADSTSKKVADKLVAHIEDEKKRFKKLSTSFAYFTERYSFDATGKRTVRLVPQ